MTREQIHIGDMSHETAIGILKLMLEAMETYDGISPTPERINAVKMAIEALDQEPILDELRAEITTLQNRCYALTQGTMCAFCKYECEYKAEMEDKK